VTKEDCHIPIARYGLRYVSTVSGKLLESSGNTILMYVFTSSKFGNHLFTAIDPPDTRDLRCIMYLRLVHDCGTGRIITTGVGEHQRHFILCQPEKSVVADHGTSHGHVICCDKAKVLGRELKY
jgi:hypothetical protein